MRVPTRPVRVLAIACAAVTVALAGAQSAEAAFAWSGSTQRTAQHCRSSQSVVVRSATEGPCFILAVEVWGNGRVTSIAPAAVPGATGLDEYPNGHIDCPLLGIWDCNFYFNWGFDGDPTVILQATLTGGQVFKSWEDCPSVEGADGLQCRVAVADSVSCVKAHFEPDNVPVPSPCDEVPEIPPPLNVVVKKTGPGSGKVTSSPGGIDCGNTCQKHFTAGTIITLTATPSTGSTFGGWSATCTSGTCTCPTTGTSCSWTVQNGVDRTVTATFNGPPPPPPLLNTLILSKPPKTTKSKSATFYWGAKNAAGTFVSSFKSQCRFDKAKAWTTCRPGKTYKKLKPGVHTFRVRVGNASGYDKTPVSYSWKVKK